MVGKVYAQVYSLIRVEREGLIDALREFSEVGYDGVEIVGANTGGLLVNEFKELLKQLKLDVIAIHGFGSEEDVELAKELGIGYVAFDASFSDKTREAVLKTCAELNEKGKALKERGIMLTIHNHADEFMWVKGEEGKTRVYDILLENTDPEYVGFQLDTGWAVRAGADVIEYIRNNPGRFPLIHVKECTKAAQTEEELEHFPKSIISQIKRDEHGTPIFTEEIKSQLYETRNWNRGLGQGLIDWKKLVEVADAQGCVAYINEREYYHFEGSDGTPSCCVKLDYDYLRSL